MILVVAANGEDIFFLGEIIGDVEGKAGISAAVSAHQPAIDIYFRIVIRAVEMQYRALPRFSLYRAGIPDRGMRRFFADTARLAFVSERHADDARQLFFKSVLGGRFFAEREFPFSAKILPIRPHQLRTRISRNITFYFLSAIGIYNAR